MRLGPTRPRTAPVADMLPILNIVLLLLAFFLILARMTPGPTPAALPRSTTGAAAAAARVIVVHHDGTVALDGQVVTDVDLVARLRAADAPLLQLQAQPGAPARRVLQLIQLAGSAGGARLQLLVAGNGDGR